MDTTATATATTTCDACHVRPAGHGHFGLYCAPCAELPYGQAAPVEAADCPVVFPFGIASDATCPACQREVGQHAGAELEELAAATIELRAAAEAPAEPAVYVAMQYNTLNTTVLRVTPQPEGMELVEYVGHLATMEREGTHPEVVELVAQARTMATVTGSKSATHRVEGAGGVLRAQATWYRNVYDAPRRVMGLHRAATPGTPEQQELAAEYAKQAGREPLQGERWVVGELTGYKLTQNRPLEHRDCSCHNGITTYSAGTVAGLTYWMDNSREATVEVDGGRKVTVQLAPPSGDACY